MTCPSAAFDFRAIPVRTSVRSGQVVYNLTVEKWNAAGLKFFTFGAKVLKKTADM